MHGLYLPYHTRPYDTIPPLHGLGSICTVRGMYEVVWYGMVCGMVSYGIGERFPNLILPSVRMRIHYIYIIEVPNATTKRKHSRKVPSLSHPNPTPIAHHHSTSQTTFVNNDALATHFSPHLLPPNPPLDRRGGPSISRVIFFSIVAVLRSAPTSRRSPAFHLARILVVVSLKNEWFRCSRLNLQTDATVSVSTIVDASQGLWGRCFVSL